MQSVNLPTPNLTNTLLDGNKEFCLCSRSRSSPLLKQARDWPRFRCSESLSHCCGQKGCRAYGSTLSLVSPKNKTTHPNGVKSMTMSS